MDSDPEGAYEPSHDESVESDVPAALGSSAATPQYVQSPRKRRATHHDITVPLKRLRSAFNTGYLDLLNKDISDAAAGVERARENENNPRGALEPSQIGAVYWKASEKKAFFSALGRLGRDDHAGIAARIRSKSPLEVAQFITLLSECEKSRKDEGATWKAGLRPAGIPAAAEISHECCVALDGIADDLSIRQETYEQTLEEKRWGEEHWLITQSLVGTGNSAKIEGELPFADLFALPNWLKLSERVFMNSSVPDYNWRHVSEELPAIRATALSDLYELTKSITKRLVATTLFMSESRIKARRGPLLRAKQAVKAKDVQAAVESLNLKTNSRDFWARAARRLRLDVQGDALQPDAESLPSSSDELTDNEDGADQKRDENPVMSYDEVEAAFGIVPSRHRSPPTELSSQYVIDEDETSASEGETQSAVAAEEDEDEVGGNGRSLSQDQEHDDLDASSPTDDEYASDNLDDGRHPPLDQEAINLDVNEVIQFSAECADTTRSRGGIRNRVTAEHVMEAEAADADARFSAQEEAELWNIVRQQQQQPSSEAHQTAAAVKREQSSEYERDSSKTAAARFTNRATMEPAVRNWRDGFRYMAEWETYGTFPTL